MTNHSVTDRQIKLLREVRDGHIDYDLRRGCFVVDGYFYADINVDLCDMSVVKRGDRALIAKADPTDPDVLPYTLTDLGAQVLQ